MFNTFKKTGSLTALLFVLSWTTAAHSAVIGIAVDDVGSFNTTGIQEYRMLMVKSPISYR